MNALLLLKEYFVWHYTRAYSDIFGLWLNFLWYVNHLFSVPDVLKTFFAPLKRLQESKGNILKDPQEFFANLTVNLLMRIVGMFVRSALILFALIGFLLVGVFGLGFLIIWSALPVLMFELLITSVSFFVTH